jgi:hypothetical protein
MLLIYLNSDSLFWGWTEANIRASKDSGAVIIEAVRRFQRHHGVLPQSLDDLVPAYLPEVPLPSAGGGEWYYGITDGGGFTLGFGMPRNSVWHGYPSCHFASTYNSWHLDE